MSKFIKNPGKGDQYQNDHRLIQAYKEATNLDEDGLEALCPSYIELSEISTRYQDQKLIGKGGVKEVYRTFDNRTRRSVAMARLREDRGPEFYDLFVNEAWLTSSLNHPNIISIHDVGIDSSGHPFFTMALKGNTTLAKLITSNDQDRNILLRIFLKICEAVAYAHSQEIIHLDLKPDNIQTDTFGEVLVCDWGLGKIISDEDDNSLTAPTDHLDNMTLVGQIKGSPGYMAPEQIESGADKDHRSDIFSLGCILHAILTGEPPFKGDLHSRIEATSQGDVTDPCESFSDLKIPPSLGAVTLKALANAPDDRYQSVSEFKNDVQRYLEGFSTNAEETNFLREASLFITRNRTPVVIGFLSLILLTVLSTLFIQKVDFLHQSVLHESQLAGQYANEANTANEQHLETLSKSKKQRIALSKSLMSSVKNLKNKGIFDTPMKSVREALALAELSLALNPKSKSAKYQLFTLNLIQLNFEEALAYPIPEDHSRHGYMSFAEAFPDFNYHRQERPPLDQLCQFIEKARELDPSHSPLIERIISYDSAVRPSKESYHDVILELVKYLNPDNPEIELEVLPQELEMILRTAKAIKLIADPVDSDECVLRYLNLRSLTVESPEKIDLHQFNGLAIQKLDLSGCASLKIGKPLSLPSLDTVIINSQTPSKEKLRRWIQSSGNFKIIEVDR
ncbi:MAG: serine/threonine-protein kinase [Akkermansiaceae bacterium]